MERALTKYRIVKYFRGASPWYRVDKRELETKYHGDVWVSLFHNSNLERCEKYVESLREVQPPTIVKEYEF